MPINFMNKSAQTPAPKPWAPKDFGAAGQVDLNKQAQGYTNKSFQEQSTPKPTTPPPVPLDNTSAGTGDASIGGAQAGVDPFMTEKNPGQTQGFQYASKNYVRDNKPTTDAANSDYDPNLGKITLGGDAAAGTDFRTNEADFAQNTGMQTDLDSVTAALSRQGQGDTKDILGMGVDPNTLTGGEGDTVDAIQSLGGASAEDYADKDLEAITEALSGSGGPDMASTGSPLTDNGKHGVMGDGINYPPYDLDGDGVVTTDELTEWEEMTGRKPEYFDPAWVEDIPGDITDRTRDAAEGKYGLTDSETDTKDQVGVGYDPKTGLYVGGSGASDSNDADTLDDMTKADWKQTLSYDYPKETPKVEETNKYGDGLATANSDALSQSLADTSSDVWEKALAQGQADINKRLGSATSLLSDELSARGLGSSGQFFQGAGELQAGAMNEAAQLAIGIKKQEIDTALQRLQQTMAFQGELMDDATKRELANQAAELEQQKLNLQTDEQKFNQQQQATEQLQAMAYNLEQMGLDPSSSSTIITETLKRLEEQGVPKTAENMMTTMLELIGEHPDWFQSPDVTPN